MGDWVILFGNEPFRLTQCCTQFKPLGSKTFCFRNFHIMMQIQYTNRSICFPGLIYCDRKWLLFLGVQIRLLTRCKVCCFTLGLSHYFSIKSLSCCLKTHMNVPKFIVWFKFFFYYYYYFFIFLYFLIKAFLTFTYKIENKKEKKKKHTHTHTHTHIYSTNKQTNKQKKIQS